MRLLEHEARALLKRFGVPTEPGVLSRYPGDLPAELPPGPWVVKSQVLTGGRMKAGAVRVVEGLPALRDTVAALWDLPVKGLKPQAVLVETKQEIATEYYCGVTYDQGTRTPLFIFSRSGGIDVEEQSGSGVGRVCLPVREFPGDFFIRDALRQAGVPSAELGRFALVCSALVRAFYQADLVLAEINPLAVLTDGRLMALDAHVELDGDALGRQKSLLVDLGITDTARQVRPPTPFEAKAAEIDASDYRGVAGRVVEFPGSMGLLIGGGGASLAAFDAVVRHGGKPANYCEIGGNPSVAKVARLTHLLLQQPGVRRVTVIMNVVNNTRSDLVARGVVKGVLAAGLRPSEAVAVFRIPGAGEDECRRLLAHWGIEALGREVSIDEAARRAVASLALSYEGG